MSKGWASLEFLWCSSAGAVVSSRWAEVSRLASVARPPSSLCQRPYTFGGVGSAYFWNILVFVATTSRDRRRLHLQPRSRMPWDGIGEFSRSLTLLLTSTVVPRRPPLGYWFTTLPITNVFAGASSRCCWSCRCAPLVSECCLQLMCTCGHVESAEQKGIHVSCAAPWTMFFSMGQVQT